MNVRHRGEAIRQVVARVFAFLVALTVLFTVPQRLVGSRSAALYSGDLGAVKPRALQVAKWMTSGVSTAEFSTGSTRFDGEWAFGTHEMAVIGLSQVLLANPRDAALRDSLLPAIRKGSEVLLAERTRAFATEAWGSDALEQLDSVESRDAWLGYVALALGMHRMVDPDFPHVALHNRLIASLRARIEASPTMLFETYPGETYPVDVAQSVGAIALHARATGGSVDEFVRRWTSKIRVLIDPASGFLSQTGPSVGAFRGSGTSLAAFALGFADPSFAKELFDALRRSGDRDVAGFSTIREYPSGQAGSGDVDSGPVVFGASVSATGFTISSARRFGDRSLFTRLLRTAELAGMPYTAGPRAGYAVGGPLGDSILLAMVTTLPVAEFERISR